MAHVVWIRRDLRLDDHPALSVAATSGPVLALIDLRSGVLEGLEPAIRPALRYLLAQKLAASLAEHGIPSAFLTEPPATVLEQLHTHLRINSVWWLVDATTEALTNDETAVQAWGEEQGVATLVLPDRGAFPAITNDEDWFDEVDDWLDQPLMQLPERVQHLDVTELPTIKGITFAGDKTAAPPPWSRAALVHASAIPPLFLEADTALLTYLDALESVNAVVLAGPHADILGVHLSLGTVSLRRIALHLRERQPVSHSSAEGMALADRLTEGRNTLLRRAATMQALVNEPSRASELSMPELAANATPSSPGTGELFTRWSNGDTGIPIVDATQRALREFGVVHPRLLDLSVSVALGPLELFWRDVRNEIAERSLADDLGTATSRVLSLGGLDLIDEPLLDPVREALEIDPDGAFVRRYIPSLARVPRTFAHQPWRLPPEMASQSRVQLGVDLAVPIVELPTAVHRATDRRSDRRLSAAGLAALERRLVSHPGLIP